MKTIDVLTRLQFQDTRPNAQPLFVGADGRIIRFALKPGQEIKEHSAPGTPLYVLVLQGHGVFTDGTGSEHSVGPNSLLVFEANEPHSVKALHEPLVFLAFLHGAPRARPDRTGGIIGRE